MSNSLEISTSSIQQRWEVVVLGENDPRDIDEEEVGTVGDGVGEFELVEDPGSRTKRKEVSFESAKGVARKERKTHSMRTSLRSEYSFR